MTRLNVALLLVLMVSAMYVVHLQYQSRSLYTALERARSDAARIAVEHEQLVVQKREQATTARVQQLAIRELGMVNAHPGITEYVQWPGASGTRPPEVQP
jgi:cell division protein FtsL